MGMTISPATVAEFTFINAATNTQKVLTIEGSSGTGSARGTYYLPGGYAVTAHCYSNGHTGTYPVLHRLLFSDAGGYNSDLNDYCPQGCDATTPKEKSSASGGADFTAVTCGTT